MAAACRKTFFGEECPADTRPSITTRRASELVIVFRSRTGQNNCLVFPFQKILNGTTCYEARVSACEPAGIPQVIGVEKSFRP
jgi:hypothetical protein